MITPPVLRSTLVAALLVLAGCVDSTTFHVSFAPNAARANRGISTLGVQRDGVMSREGWRALGPEQPAPFGGQLCAVAFSAESLESTPGVVGAIDAYVRANGATEQLLEQVAPAAIGDTLLFFSISGAATRTGSAALGQAPMPGTRGGRSMGGGGGRGQRAGGLGAAGTVRGDSGDGFHVRATLFSVSERRTVANIEMNYSGTNLGEALMAFRARLEAELPGAHCAGWDWSKPVAIQPAE